MTLGRSNAVSFLASYLAVACLAFAAGCGSDLDVGSAPRPAGAADTGAPGQSTLSADGSAGDGAALLPGHGCDGGPCVGSWTESARITLDDTQPGALFGASLARDGDLLFVGAPCEGGSGFSSSFTLSRCPGAVHSFRLVDTEWLPEQVILPSATETNGRFGAAVAESGGTLFVGAPGEESVLVYTRSGGTWTRTQALEGSSTNDFGENIVATSDLVAVNWKGGTGGIDVFRQIGGTWVLDVTWTGQPSNPLAFSTTIFALDSDRLFVTQSPLYAATLDGGSADADVCWVQIYDWSPGTLTLAQSIGYPAANCSVGDPLPFGVDGSRLAVGRAVPNPNDPSPITALDVFDQQDGGDYTLSASVVNDEEAAQTLPLSTGDTNASVSVAGNEVVWETASGCQLYTGSGTSWAAEGPPAAALSSEGYSGYFTPSSTSLVAFSSDYLLAGMPWETNYAELTGGVEEYLPYPQGLVAYAPPLLGATEILAIPGSAFTALGSVIAAGAGVAVVGGDGTGLEALENDGGAWQVGGPLITTGSGGDYAGGPGVSWNGPNVAVNGQTIAFASHFDVSLFTRGADGWGESAYLDTHPFEFEPYWAISFDGTTLAGPCEDTSNSINRLCLVDTTGPTLTIAALPLPSPVCNEAATSLGGDTLLVAATQCDTDDPGESQTETYVYQRSASGWASAGSLTAEAWPGSVMDDVYGVVTDGVTAAVTVDHLLGGTTRVPTVTFFSRENGAWQKTQTVEVKTPTAGNLLLDGELLYVSDAPIFGQSAAGSDVVVLARQAGKWSVGTTLGESTGTTFPIGFGTSIALSGHDLLVGSPQETVNGKLGWGSIYAFDTTLPPPLP